MKIIKNKHGTITLFLDNNEIEQLRELAGRTPITERPPIFSDFQKKLLNEMVRVIGYSPKTQKRLQRDFNNAELW